MLYTARKAIQNSPIHSLRTQGRKYPAKIDYFKIPYWNFRFYLLICLCCISIYRGQIFLKNRHTSFVKFPFEKKKTISLILNPPHRILFRGYPALYTATKAIRKSSDHSLRTQGRKYPAKIDYFEIPYCNFRFYLLICLCCITLYRGQIFLKNRRTSFVKFSLKKRKQCL